MKKQCKACEWYPNDCGYWDEKFRRKKENRGASFISNDHVHDCVDYSFDPTKISGQIIGGKNETKNRITNI